MTGPVAPVSDPWTLAVHDRERDGETDFAPFGTAVVISPRRALTCAHVVLGDGRVREPIWVSFPKVTSLWRVRRRVSRVEYDRDDPRIADVAVLHFAEDLPVAAEPVRLRSPEPHALVGLRWWAFGFPVSSRLHGNEAQGRVGARLAHGWVRLDTDSPYPVEEGFSGGGLWVAEYSAVVGIVGQARVTGSRGGDAQALTIAQADLFLPAEKLRVLVDWQAIDAGPVAMASWGWKLDTDRETGRHWSPRGRGVTTDADRGYRFRGRSAALRTIVTWLDRPVPDRRVLVVTGSPGVGKSAVLGRIVTTADAGLRDLLPGDDRAVRASIASIGCAVHAKGKTALEVATEIATAASAALPGEPDDLAGAVRDRLRRSPGRFNVVIDALDEAATADEARLIVNDVVLPLVQSCAELGAQVVLGTRRHDGRGSLLAGLAPVAELVDLDDARFFEVSDLQAYAVATLRLVGDERPGNPYDDPGAAAAVGWRIAELASGNFLVAGLEARRRGMYDQHPADPAAVTLTPSVDDTLDLFVRQLPPVDGLPARDVLTALAYAEAPGWTTTLWRVALGALGGQVTEAMLDRFARSAAANFLVESSQEGRESVFRLFHQALNDALLRPRGPGGARADEQLLTRDFLVLGRDRGWSSAPAYLLRSLAGHAGRAGLSDDLLADHGYLLHADLLRLIPAAAEASTPAGREQAQLLRLTPQAVAASPAERAAMLNVTQALQGLPPTMAHPRMPYRARWAHTTPRTEHATLEGHTSEVRAVCTVEVGGRMLLASAGYDKVIRLWDLATGNQHSILNGHTSCVSALCTVEIGGRTLLASASYDQTIRLWDPATGNQQNILEGHSYEVRAVCTVEVDGHTLLASASYDKTVRLWDVATGNQHSILKGHTSGVNAVCTVDVGGRTLLASAGYDKTVRLWDPAGGSQHSILKGHTNWVYGVCAVEVGGRTLLASTGDDEAVRLWDPATGRQQSVLEGHTDWVHAVCAVEIGGRTLLASAGDDRTVRLWDPATGRQHSVLQGHTSEVAALCALELGGRTMLASAGRRPDRAVVGPDHGTQQHHTYPLSGDLLHSNAQLHGDRRQYRTADSGREVLCRIVAAQPSIHPCDWAYSSMCWRICAICAPVSDCTFSTSRSVTPVRNSAAVRTSYSSSSRPTGAGRDVAARGDGPGSISRAKPALSPRSPTVGSNSTRRPGRTSLRCSPKSLAWTNTSSPPPSGLMKP